MKELPITQPFQVQCKDYQSKIVQEKLYEFDQIGWGYYNEKEYRDVEHGYSQVYINVGVNRKNEVCWNPTPYKPSEIPILTFGEFMAKTNENPGIKILRLLS